MIYRLVSRARDGGLVIAARLCGVRTSWRAVWVLPAALGAVVTGYLAWGAWVSAHDPRWAYLGQAWWRAWLRPDSDQALLAAAVLWFAAFLFYWWPRRLQPRLVG